MDAYDIIADILHLANVKDNIYIDDNNNKFYRDNYGFHTTNQLANIQLLDVKVLEERAETINRRTREVIQREIDIIGKRSKKYIRNIATATRMTDAEKIQYIIEYLSK